MKYDEQIQQGIAFGVTLPTSFPQPWDKWLAASTLQKSIRRGYTDTALLMTRGFLVHDPDYFWRRINVIALEDVSVANLPLVNQVLWVSGKLAWIRAHDEAAIAAYLVQSMCESVKDRNAAEAMQVVDKHPEYLTHRQTYPEKPFNELVSIALGECLYTSTLAIWTLLGTKKYYSDHFYSAGYERERVLEALNPDEEVAELVRLSWSKTTYGIPVGCLALQSQLKNLVQSIAPENPLPTGWAGIYPLCSLDMYVRTGKRALFLWATSNQSLQRFLSQHLQKEEWVRYLGNVVFAVESENVNLRLTYADHHKPVWKTLQAELVTEGFTLPHLQNLVAIVREEFPSLNDARRSCLK